MMQNGLYSQLIKSLYSLDGRNAEFLSALSQPIPFVPSDHKWEKTGILARIPSRMSPGQEWLADLRKQLSKI